MVQYAVASFVGCFTALLVMAEVQATNKVIKYAVALVAGIIAAVLLALLVAKIIGLFERAG